MASSTHGKYICMLRSDSVKQKVFDGTIMKLVKILPILVLKSRHLNVCALVVRKYTIG